MPMDWRMMLMNAVPPRSVRRWLRKPLYRRVFAQHLRPTDFFLVGHHKSGNTWLTYMLTLLLHRQDHEHITLGNLRRYSPEVSNKDFRIAEYSALGDPRMFRNHWPLYPELCPKVIYLIRDPRSVIVSLYHMYRIMMNDPSLSLDAFVKEYVSSGRIRKWPLRLVRWDKHVRIWKKRAENDERVLIVRYEDMMKDRRESLARAAGFLKIPYSEGDLRLAVACGEFKAMQTLEARHGTDGYPGEMGQRGQFVRRGESNGWKDELSDEMARYIEREFASVMRTAGYL